MAPHVLPFNNQNPPGMSSSGETEQNVFIIFVLNCNPTNNSIHILNKQMSSMSSMSLRSLLLLCTTRHLCQMPNNPILIRLDSLEPHHTCQHYMQHIHGAALCGHNLQDVLDQLIIGLINPAACRHLQSICHPM